jgi:hypothetical protein
MIAPKRKAFMPHDKPSLLLGIEITAFSPAGTADPVDDEARGVD